VTSPALVDLVRRGGVLALTGAGISTESGIPDYRGPTGVARGATPMTYQELVGSDDAVRRYWARSYAGWPTMRRARPNPGHHALAALERLGLVDGVITQNVDRLHRHAGTRVIVELHGALDRVVCLACRDVSRRDVLQERLAAANPDFDPGAFDQSDGDTARVRPDGDVALVEEKVRRFSPVACRACGAGPLKPDVVFFGENVPRDRVRRCMEMVEAASALLVLGSSLTVMSGYRFVRQAARAGTPVAIVNHGPTRGDAEASLRVDAPLGACLSELVELVAGPHSLAPG
jgi:NAD-dependent SIR2 family protein deacetylase